MNQSIHPKVQKIVEQTASNSDLTTRMFQTPFGQQGALLFLKGITNQETLDQVVLAGYLLQASEAFTRDRLAKTFPVSNFQFELNPVQAGNAVYSGYTVLVLDGIDEMLLIGMQNWPERSPGKPEIESSIKGSQQSFVETIRVNISMLRHYLPNPRLRVEEMRVGSLTETPVALVYVDGIVNRKALKVARQRLQAIETDSIISCSQIEAWIEDNGWTVFPLMRTTERTDVAIAALIEGKIAILCEHSPFVLIVPFTFFDSLQNMDDYFEKWHIGIMFRFVRLTALMISVLLPGLYISLVHYNTGLIPTELLISMMAAIMNVPFLLLVELLLMEFTIEIFREAGIRLPKPLGQTIGIVGGIVLGEAAIRAHLVSPATLMVVAVTAMASYSAPLYSLAHSFRLVRFWLTLLAAVLGLYGYILGVLTGIAHLASLKSFGSPYLSPVAPSRVKYWVDSFILFPLRKRNYRPGEHAHPKRKSRSKPLKEG